MCTQPLGPFRTNAAPEQRDASHSMHPVFQWYFVLMGTLVSMAVGGYLRGRTLNDGNATRQQRDNATVEAAAAARRLFGAPPNAVYCRPEVGSMVCERRYPHWSNLCDVFVPNVGSVQLCCDTHDYRNNTGCSVRVVTLGDLQWQQATQ